MAKAKPGEIKIYWNKKDRDVGFSWGGGDDAKGIPFACKADANMVISHFDFTPSLHGTSFLEELESRGYDLTTIKFSIQKKRA